MNIHKNIGNFDFVLRVVLLLVFIYLSLKVSVWFYLLVVWEIFVLFNRWCFVYDLLGMDTLGGKK
jgi:hypothetical protein